MKNSTDNLYSGPSKVPLMNIPKVVGGSYHGSTDTTLFSSSLPVLRHEKLNLNATENGFQSIDDASSRLIKTHQDIEEDNESFGDIGPHAIGNLLPGDEDDLLAGIMDDFDFSRLPRQMDELQEFDIFDSGGGLELENGLSDEGIVSGMGNLGISNGAGTVAGEHPFGEHPSRTLFVRNINSNVEDSELKTLFEQYGDIRTLYTACKHRGFVMISYYDIRAARTAMRALQNKALRRRKLDIHFSIPKDNPTDKDINQGTLVVLNIDPSISNDELRHIFGEYGEVKEIRETPHKRHNKFIEFYDVRAAETALRALKRSDIAGKRIKLEPSRPGGAGRNLTLQPNQELELDETRTFRNQIGSPLANSPPSNNWVQFNSPNEHNPTHTFSKSPNLGTSNPIPNYHISGLASILQPQTSNSVKIAPIGKDQGRNSHFESMFSNSNSNSNSNSPIFPQSHSFPDQKLNHFSETMASLGTSTKNGHSSIENGSVIETLSGPQFLWGSPSTHSEQTKPFVRARPSTGNPFNSGELGNGNVNSGSLRGSFLSHNFPSPNLNQHNHNLYKPNPNPNPNHHLHIGSAPSGFPLERHLGVFQESPQSSFMNSVYGGMNLGHNDRSFMMNMGHPISRNMPESGSPNFGMMSSQRGASPMFLGYPGFAPSNMDNFADRGRIRRVENNGIQIDTKKQFQLDLDKIVNGEDSRTTLMIKNIPNKYTSKMLLAAIDEYNRGTYDFLYLPIDFKNKCNVGYAFINMLSAKHIIQFYKAFNGKKWEKFNSEKVANLAYARIQGKAALVTHFQNSSLMNEDKRCRPILFHSEGRDFGDQVIQEHLSSNSMNINVRQPNGSRSGESQENLTEINGAGNNSEES